mgnify:CR=1 FL=1
MMMTSYKGDIFIDTNILLRHQIRNFAEYPIIKKVVDELFDDEYRIWINWQVIREFSAVCTRPQKFMNPLSPITISSRISTFLPMFDVADGTSAVNQALLALMRQFPMGGKQIHDANIIATMQVYGIRNLFTLNISDFERFGSLIHIVKIDSLGNILNLPK